MNQALPCRLYACILGVSFLSRIFAAGSVSLAWDRNPDPAVVGYRIYYGPLSTKMQVIDTGAASAVSVTNLLSGATYQFYATAYNSEGLESAPSGVITYSVPPPVVSATTDTDGDGLPDSYEIANGLNPYDPSDASADNDGDGITNLQEYDSGTNPNDPGSSLRISAVKMQGGTVIIQFTTIQGLIYVLQATDNFPTGPWSSISTGVTGTGAGMQLSDVSSSASLQRMYRVVTTAPNQTQVSSEPAGFQRLNLQPRSDTITSAALFRPAAFQGTVGYANGSAVQLNGANWSANQFAYAPGVQTNTYFVLLRGGLREGDSFIVTGNTSDSVLLQTYGDTLWGISPGDPISVIPFWTLASIFPGGQGVLASSSPAVRPTEILMPDIANNGINLATAATYYFLNGSWRQVGDGSGVHNDDVVLPDMFFWVRQNTSVGTQLTVTGVALVTKWRFPVYRDWAAAQDNVFAMPRPSAVSLKESGLIESGGFRASSSAVSRLDELLLFDNSSPGQNKSATGTYYYLNGAWRRVGAGSFDAGGDIVFTPGTGVIIRSGAGSSAIWINNSPL